ncbi:F-box domain-containing protein [Mycena chlorophos]|uniref:F-box domain-containing protein n=1 Tax=Mycena chlorophos TaxID=658473 RepID=A0A8H6TH69_MYCCL|nr:F-box domain-containing protein [Mycena chlorophos]
MASLPDEIISEILSPALKVADADFSSHTYTSPFARFSESTSAYLLVCKAWLRVATPLLYNVVVLRSSAQAKALATVLNNNAQLASFIKKLRVEGGYGAAMHTILKCTPNITDLFLTFAFDRRDSTDGLVKGLKLINPRRLIAQHARHNSDAAAQKLRAAVVEAAPHWDRLTVLDISSHTSDAYGYGYGYDVATKAVADQNRLQEIVVDSVESAGQWHRLSLFQNCPLQIIRVATPLRSQSDVDSASRLQKQLSAKGGIRLQYDIDIQTVSTSHLDSSAAHVPHLNPHFVPMQHASSEVRDAVWSRILSFAISPDNDYSRSLLRVCKSFLTLGRPYLYADIALTTRSATLKLVRTLKQQPSYGTLIRSLNLAYSPRHPRYTWGLAGDLATLKAAEAAIVPGCEDPLLEIFRTTTSLQTLISQTCVFSPAGSDAFTIPNIYGPRESISWTAMEQLIQVAGSTLRELRIDPANRRSPGSVYPSSHTIAIHESPPSSRSIFSRLTQLRKLTWRSSASFDADSLAAAAFRDVFPRLEELEIWEAHPTFVGMLCKMRLVERFPLSPLSRLTMFFRLPTLKRLVLLPKFKDLLQAHGPRLKSLVVGTHCLRGGPDAQAGNALDACIGLEELTILCVDVFLRSHGYNYNGSRNNENIPTIAQLRTSQPLAAVKKIHFVMSGGGQSGIVQWTTFFEDFGPMMRRWLPALEEVQLSWGSRWPTVEGAMVKNPWIRIAEGLLAFGVQAAGTDDGDAQVSEKACRRLNDNRSVEDCMFSKRNGLGQGETRIIAFLFRTTTTSARPPLPCPNTRHSFTRSMVPTPPTTFPSSPAPLAAFIQQEALTLFPRPQSFAFDNANTSRRDRNALAEDHDLGFAVVDPLVGELFKLGVVDELERETLVRVLSSPPIVQHVLSATGFPLLTSAKHAPLPGYENLKAQFDVGPVAPKATDALKTAPRRPTKPVSAPWLSASDWMDDFETELPLLVPPCSPQVPGSELTDDEMESKIAALEAHFDAFFGFSPVLTETVEPVTNLFDVQSPPFVSLPTHYLPEPMDIDLCERYPLVPRLFPDESYPIVRQQESYWQDTGKNKMLVEVTPYVGKENRRPETFALSAPTRQRTSRMNARPSCPTKPKSNATAKSHRQCQPREKESVEQFVVSRHTGVERYSNWRLDVDAGVGMVEREAQEELGQYVVWWAGSLANGEGA